VSSRAFRSLQVRDYRLFLAGQLISVSGTAMQQVAQDWLVASLTGRALSVALASVLQLAPVLALAPLGGALADRVDRRELLVATQAVLALLALALATLALFHAIHLWTVYLLAGLLGCATAFDMPARQALVGDLVGPERVAGAVALNHGTLSAARVVGPAVAAGLVGALGVGAAFLVNGLSYLAVIAGLRRMDPAVGPVDRPRAPVRASAIATPPLRRAILLMGSAAAVGANLQVVLPLLVRSTFHGGAALFALLMATLAGGSVLGALLAAAAAWPGRGLQVAAAAAFGACTALIGVAGAPAVAAGALLLAGVACGAALSLTNGFVQATVAPDARGRVLALNGMAYRVALLAGALVLGFLADRVGAPATLRLAGVAMLVATLALSPCCAARRRSRSPSAAGRGRPSDRGGGRRRGRRASAA
jgi:MFS family permease